MKGLLGQCCDICTAFVVTNKHRSSSNGWDTEIEIKTYITTASFATTATFSRSCGSGSTTKSF